MSVAFVFGPDRQLLVGLPKLSFQLPALIVAVRVRQKLAAADRLPHFLRDGLGVDILVLLLEPGDIVLLPLLGVAFAAGRSFFGFLLRMEPLLGVLDTSNNST